MVNTGTNFDLIKLTFSATLEFLLPNPEAIISYFYLFHRLKKSERIFIHKSLLLSLGLGNLVYVSDISFFTTREENVVSKRFCIPFTSSDFQFYLAFFSQIWYF